jgi:hypothetical protein
MLIRTLSVPGKKKSGRRSTALVVAALFVFLIPAVSGESARESAHQPLAIPAIRPGTTLAQVEGLIGKAEFEGAPEHNLRSLNWHQTPMMIMVLVDTHGVVASVMFQLKNRPFTSDDGVISGRDTLRVAAAKLGARVLKHSEIGYVADASCFGASITARSKASADWVTTYEALECDQGEQSVEKLPRSPINNVTIATKSLSPAER